MAKSMIGDVRPGDYVTLSRIVYVSVDPTTITGFSGTVTVFDSAATPLGAFPAVISSLTPLATPPHGGRSGFQLDYQLTIPDTLLPTPEGDVYTAVLALNLTSATGPVVVPDIQEAFRVLGNVELPAGAAPEVVLSGMPASLEYTFPAMPTSLSLDIYLGNVLQAHYPVPLVTGPTVGWTGLTAAFPLDTTPLQPSLMPYAAIWTVNGTPDIAPLFVINPSIHLAMKELHNQINKNCSDWGLAELTMTPEQLIAALYNGACLFNAAHYLTNFSMLNAQGMIRTFWLQYSAVWLLQSQSLNGIETDFSFSSSSTTLDVDRAAKYQQFADSLLSQISEACRPLKFNLNKRGQIDGDGSNNPLALRNGAIGAISMSLSPVSKVGTMFNPLSWRAALLNPGASMNLI